MTDRADIISRVLVLVARTQMALSFQRYGPAEWGRAIRLLIDRGYSDMEIEAIMMSQWTRWAQEQAGADGRGDDLINWMDSPRNAVTKDHVAQLVRATFGKVD